MDCCEVPRLQHDDNDDGIGRRKNHVIVTGEFYSKLVRSEFSELHTPRFCYLRTWWSVV
jgi:hypothetical protein